MIGRVPRNDSERSPRLDVLRFFWSIARASPLPLLARVIFVVVGNLRVAIYLAAQGALVDSLIRGDGRLAAWWVLIWLVANGIEEIYWALDPWLLAIVRDETTYRIRKQILEACQQFPLESFEEANVYSKLRRANDDVEDRVSGLLSATFEMLEQIVMGVAISGTLWIISPWLVPVLVLATIPGLIGELHVADAVQRVRRKHAIADQFMKLIENLASNRQAAVEIRLFGSGDFLTSRWREARRRRADDVLAAEWRRSRFGFGSEFLHGCAIAICVAIALREIGGRNLSVGSWLIFATGIDWLSTSLRSLLRLARQMGEQVSYSSDYMSFIHLVDELGDRPADSDHPELPIGTHGSGPSKPLIDYAVEVDLVGVTFTYPGSERPAVRDVSLHLDAGEVVALVGDNGAGKTTLVMLMLGLYVPDAGVVRIGGIDAKGRCGVGPHPRLGAVFQDFIEFQLTLRDNVAFGDVARPVVDLEIVSALGAVGASALPGSMDGGLGAWLGREFGGRELSGGQWQKVALARAIYRDTAFLAMDEPTAALDPLSEQTIYEEFVEILRERTGVIVSHRLASAQLADRIIVLKDGTIVEIGTHAELMRGEREYYRMFASQVSLYADNESAEFHGGG